MPVGIPTSLTTRRYHQKLREGQGADVDLSTALRAYADDLIGSGDPRLALERAFRWGYQGEDGEHVPGLQEHVQRLRHHRDRLLRRIEDEMFLKELAGVLDEIDAVEREAIGTDRGDADSPTLRRLSDRIERGYDSPEAWAKFDMLMTELREVADEVIGEKGAGRRSGQAGDGDGALRPARSAPADTVRRMLFQGGVPSNDMTPATGAWRQQADAKDAIQAGWFDLEALAELELVERQLATLSSLGSVTMLEEADLEDLGDDETGAWLSAWSNAIGKLGGAPGRPRRVSLPPDVIRAISRDLLKGLFRAAASPSLGEHHSTLPGAAGDSAEGTLPWEQGRPLDLHLVATLSNAIRRAGVASRGRIDLRPQDFEVVERTATTAVSTVLAVDRSRSMGQSGAWISAKKVSLALHELIRQAYPRDSLDVIAFSSTAERVDFESIPEMRWDEFEHGTHLQAALELGRRLHRRSRSGTRQIVVITDGEPTLATVIGAQVFASPPTDDVLKATMSEVLRCTREGIVINLVMLGSGERPSAFAEQIARVNRGRIFIATSENLGASILRDYVGQ